MRLLAVLASLALAACAAPVSAGEVGFRLITVSNDQDAPQQVGIWYPTDSAASPQPLQLTKQTVAPDAPVSGRARPLVVISHGSGGSLSDHYDTAIALAKAGFVVAAPTHTGDNFRDMSRAARIAGRPAQLEAVVEYMLAAWPDHDRIDASKVGAFGFSAGGFTVLALAGGNPDLSKIRDHCVAHPDFFECQLLKRYAPQALAGGSQPAARLASVALAHDARLKAIVVAAPALGYTFAPDGLGGVEIPVQLWRASEDSVLHDPFYVEPVRDALPLPPDYRVAEGADHMDFLAPCGPELAKAAPAICTEAKGFDRTAFHERFNRELVAFFEAKLGVR